MLRVRERRRRVHVRGKAVLPVVSRKEAPSAFAPGTREKEIRKGRDVAAPRGGHSEKIEHRVERVSEDLWPGRDIGERTSPTARVLLGSFRGSNLAVFRIVGPSSRPGKAIMEAQGTSLIDSAEANDALVLHGQAAAPGIFASLQQQTQQLAPNVLFLDQPPEPWDGRVD